LLYFTENALKESELCIGCSSWVEILCSVLFAHLNLTRCHTIAGSAVNFRGVLVAPDRPSWGQPEQRP